MFFECCLKKLSSPNIVYTMCLINEDDFSITHIMIVILKVSVKWRLFDVFPLMKFLWARLYLLNLDRKLLVLTCILFWICFAWQKIRNIAGTAVQVIWLNAIFSMDTERSKCFGIHYMFAYFARRTSTWSVTTFLLFKRWYFYSHKNVFQIFSSSKPNYSNFLKNILMFSVRC